MIAAKVVAVMILILSFAIRMFEDNETVFKTLTSLAIGWIALEFLFFTRIIQGGLG